MYTGGGVCYRKQNGMGTGVRCTTYTHSLFQKIERTLFSPNFSFFHTFPFRFSSRFTPSQSPIFHYHLIPLNLTFLSFLSSFSYFHSLIPYSPTFLRTILPSLYRILLPHHIFTLILHSHNCLISAIFIHSLNPQFHLISLTHSNTHFHLIVSIFSSSSLSHISIFHLIYYLNSPVLQLFYPI